MAPLTANTPPNGEVTAQLSPDTATIPALRKALA